VAKWLADGWPGDLTSPLSDLVRYESLRRTLGDVAVEGSSGPVVAWPWDSWSLVEHRALIAGHFREMGAITRAESAALGM